MNQLNAREMTILQIKSVKKNPLNNFALVASPIDVVVIGGGASGTAVLLFIKRAILERSYIYCKKITKIRLVIKI
jgi:hypothetical protein